MRELFMKIKLPVPQILQNPELVNGCEITSLCEVLNFLGFDADKCDLADNYLPRSEFWRDGDPDEVYMGDPHREDDTPMCGFYCFAGPVVKACNKYLEVQGRLADDVETQDTVGTHDTDNYVNRLHPSVAKYIAVDITGAEEADLIAHLEAGRPFIFWASLHFNDIGFDPCGVLTYPNGKQHRVFHTLHCMVCSGADNDYFYITDPLDYNTKVPRDQFMEIYKQLGSRAVIIKSTSSLEAAPL